MSCRERVQFDVPGCLPVLVDPIRPVGDQAAGGGEGTIGVDRRQLVSGRQLGEQLAMTLSRRAGRNDQAAI